MRLIYFMYFKIMKHNDNVRTIGARKAITYIQILVIVLMYWMAVSSIIDNVFSTHLLKINGWLDTSENRRIKILLLFIPFYLVIDLFFRVNSKAVEAECKRLEQLPSEDLKAKNRGFVVFLIITGFIFLLGMTSFAWVDVFR